VHHTQGGWTALIRAAECGQTECVRLLLVNGADKEIANDVRTPVIFFIHETIRPCFVCVNMF
jgi:ankyrin repeat protein